MESREGKDQPTHQPTNSNNSSFELLPEERILQINHYLDPESLVNFSLACRRFFVIAKDKSLEQKSTEGIVLKQISLAFTSLSSVLQIKLDKFINSLSAKFYSKEKKEHFKYLKLAIDVICRKAIPECTYKFIGKDQYEYYSFLGHATKQKVDFCDYPFNFVVCNSTVFSSHRLDKVGKTLVGTNYDAFMRLMFRLQNEINYAKDDNRYHSILEEMINEVLNKYPATRLQSYSTEIQKMLANGKNYINGSKGRDWLVDRIDEFTKLNAVFATINKRITTHLEKKNKETPAPATNNSDKPWYRKII